MSQNLLKLMKMKISKVFNLDSLFRAIKDDNIIQFNFKSFTLTKQTLQEFIDAELQ